MSSKRAIEKKLLKLVKDFIAQKPEILSLIESADSPFALVLKDISTAVNYKDDLASLKSDAEALFKSLSKLRGKRKEVAEISEEFVELFNESFPDLLESEATETPAKDDISRAKRPRHPDSIEVSAPPSKKLVVADDAKPLKVLSKEVKASIRTILTEISKMDPDNFFMYPVDSNAYPEYYELIENPKDISTIKNSLNSYTSVEDALNDIRLIWDNCKRFNAEGSEIANFADSLAEATEDLIAKHLGPEFKRKKSARKKEKPTESSASMSTAPESEPSKPTKKSIEESGEKFISRKALSRIVDSLKKHELAFVFLHPVNPDDAPGYLDIISHPMDISTIDQRVKSGHYDTDSASFVRDVDLIWSNCLTYNDPNSDIGGYAQTLASFFYEAMLKIIPTEVTPPSARYLKTLIAKKRKEKEVVVEQVVADKPDEDAMDIDAPADEVDDVVQDEKGGDLGEAKKRRLSTNKLKKSDLSPIGRAMWSCVDEIKEHPKSAPFSKPISSKTPGYFDVVKVPMDLSTVRSKIASYEEDPEKFLDDMVLIFDNCQTYNVEGSEIYDWAEELRKLAIDKFYSYFRKGSDGKFALIGSTKRRKAQKVVEEIEPENAIENSSANVDASADYSVFGKATTLREVDDMIAYLKSDQAIRTITVKTAAAAKMSEIRSKSFVPWFLIPDVYEIHNLGAISTAYGCHDQTFIYPMNFKSTRLVQVAIIPEKASDQTFVVPIAISSVILPNAGFVNPRFTLMIEGGTVVAEGSSPLEAWQTLLRSESIENVLRVRGDRLKNCRALLNRICVNPLSQGYIDFNNSHPSAPNYKVPLCFREIRRRLDTGFYDNEFDFAWDVRYIFRTAAEANDESVPIAKTLSDLFEYLFCKWVVNFQHRSITDIARGPWLDWYHLKLFDGSKLGDDSTACQSCGDHVAEIPPDAEGLYCSRCAEVRNEPPTPTYEELKNLPPQRGSVAYTREDVGLASFVPNSELGPGWLQAQRAKRGGLKNTFLSPLGFFYRDKIDVEKVKAAEKGFHEQLTADILTQSNNPRSIGLRDDVELNHYSYNGWTRKKGLSASTASGLLPRLPLGKLVDFKLPPGHRLAVYVHKNESQAHDALTLNRSRESIFESILPDISVDPVWEEIRVDQLPETGYYGFEIPDVKIRIESLPATELLDLYRPLSAEFSRQIIIEGLLKEREVLAQQNEFESSLNDIVLHERWRLEKKRNYPLPPVNVPPTDIGYLSRLGFLPLVPKKLTYKHAEVLMCVWDILDGICAMAGDWTYSLSEVFECLDKSEHQYYTSFGNAIFDEICCLFSGFLLQDISFQLGVSQSSWQTMLVTQPLNVLTWPQILRTALVASNRNGWSKDQTITILQRPRKPGRTEIVEILSIIEQHPLVRLLKEIGVSTSDHSCSAAIQALETIRSFRNESFKSQFESIDSFSESLFSLTLPTTDEKILMIWTSFIAWYKTFIPLWIQDSSPSIADDFFTGGIVEVYAQFMSKRGDDGIVLKPHHFDKTNPPSQLLTLHLGQFSHFVKALKILKQGDQESWSVLDKVSVLIVCLDSIAECNIYLDFLKDRRKITKQLFTKLDCSSAPTSRPLLSIVNATAAEVEFMTCCYTGAVMKSLTSLQRASRVVIVPDEYLHSPDPDESKAYVSPGVTPLENSGKYVTLESYVLRIGAAREKCELEEINNQERIDALAKDLFLSPAEVSEKYMNFNNFFLKTQPIGYDRHGSEYWLLSAQEAMTLVPLGAYTIQNLTNNETLPTHQLAVDPSILVRHLSGWWGFHNGLRVSILVDSFSREIDCENILRQNLISRLVFARYKLYTNTLRPKSHQREWLLRRQKLELFVKDIPRIQVTSDNHAVVMKHSEELWAKIYEVRQLVQYSMLLRKDYDIPRAQPRAEREAYLRRQKRIRETNADDTWDLHPFKGWLRFHCLAHVRELGASLTASRLHADVDLLPALKEAYSRSDFRARWIETTSSRVEAQKQGIVEEIPDDAVLSVGLYLIDSDRTDAGGSMLADKAGDSSDPLLRDVDKSSAGQGHTKAVEQLHAETGEVLRIYPSGKVAASFMGVSQTGISLCCCNKQAEAYGFRWRFYEGPKINWEAIEDKQMSLSQLEAIAAMRKREGKGSTQVNHEHPSALSAPQSDAGRILSQPSSKPPVTIAARPIAPGIIPAAGASRLAQQAMLSLPNVVASTVLLPPRLTKLKVELLNLLFILPEKALRWPDDESTTTDVVPTSKEDADAVEMGTTKSIVTQDAPKEDGGNVSEKEGEGKADANPSAESAEDRALRKKKRREKRRLANERILTRIQKASGPQELLDCLISIENAMPVTWMLDYDKAAFPPICSTAAEVAIRLFTIDRVLRYEDIPGLDSVGSKLTYRPRLNFVPRCMVAVTCKSPLCHNVMVKCGTIADASFSRYYDITEGSSMVRASMMMPQYPRPNLMPVPSMYGAPNPWMSSAPRPMQPPMMHQNYQFRPQNRRIPGRDEEEEEDEFDDDAPKGDKKNVVNIDFIQPYLPPVGKITMMEWL